jgi:hypothetical protein
VAAASRWMSDVWDQNCALHAMSPLASSLERVVEGWMVELLGLDPGTALGLVGGSSVATLCKTLGIVCCTFEYIKKNCLHFVFILSLDCISRICMCNVTSTCYDRRYCGCT